MSNFWHNFKAPIIGLAPMDGVTDYPMRKIQTDIYKPDVIYTEFINTDAAIYSPKTIENHLKFDEGQRPIVAQIFGSKAKNFPKIVEKAIKKGFDGIDINMGCPAPKILSLGAGASLMKDEINAEKVITAVEKTIKENKSNIPLSVKTRIFLSEEKNNHWFEFLAKLPLSEVSIHGRPIEQNHSGDVYWNRVDQANNILKSKGIICLGNGGIKNPTQGRKLADQYSLDGMLIGQAAMGNPWTFIDNYEPTIEERFKTIIKHSKLAYELYGEKGFITIRKHLAWYSKGFPGAKELRKQLVQVTSVEEVKKILKYYPKESQINKF